MATVLGASKTKQAAAGADSSAAEIELTTAAASDDARAVAAEPIDPQLLMAARRGDSKRLRELLLLNVDGTVVEAAAALSSEVVIVEVDGRRPPPAARAAGAPTAPLPLDWLAMERPADQRGTGLLHAVAASGDGDDFLECAKMIYDHNSDLLLVARNADGDTPLHCAAGAGSATMISRLIALAASGSGGEAAKKELLRAHNKYGETALHHAVRAGSMAAIVQLLSVDPELACSGAPVSPMYLAVSLGEKEIAHHLLYATRGKISYSGPHGRNVLHAAVSRGEALSELLTSLEHVMVDVQGGDGRHVPLVAQLTKQRDTQSGSTPLHLAASLGGWPLGWMISTRSPQAWSMPESATRLLLDANVSAAYQPDNQGSYPIHVAAWTGSLVVVKTLLEKCPDCATLRDAEGRTFLHVAVDKESRGVVRYVCRTAALSSLLNAQDNNGDTALHRAVHAGNLAIFNYLVRNPKVRLDVPNKETITPADLSLCKIPSKFYYTMNPRVHILMTLLYMGAPYGESRPDLFSEQHTRKGDDEDKISQKLTEATQVLGIVSVLVATVTFASAFTLPGGYRSADGSGDPGTPLLAGSYAFNAFVLADALAFICSCLATFSLVYAGVPSVDLSIRFTYISISSLLLKNSARSLVVAFALGLYVVLAPVARTVAITVCVTTLASMLFGNWEALNIVCMAITAGARFGRIRLIPTVTTPLRAALMSVVLDYWSFIIIFGLPAILRK